MVVSFDIRRLTRREKITNQKGSNMIKFLWNLTILGSVAGILVVVGVLFSSQEMSAPQEAAAFSGSISLAVIPYCLARAVSEARSLSPKEE